MGPFITFSLLSGAAERIAPAKLVDPAGWCRVPPFAGDTGIGNQAHDFLHVRPLYIKE